MAAVACRKRIAPAVASLLMAACVAGESGQATDSAHPTVTDSGGMRIVEYPGPPEGLEQMPWRLAEQPTLVIGRAEEGESQILVGIAGAVLLEDGGVATALALDRQLRVYDRNGELLHKLGGPGSGPGEFRAIGHLWITAGDTLAAYDFRSRQFNFYTTTGEFLRAVRFDPLIKREPTTIMGTVLGFAGGDTAVAFGEVTGNEGLGLRRGRRVITLLAMDGGEHVIGKEIDGAEVYSEEVRPGLASLNTPPFGRNSIATAAGKRIALAYNDAFVVDELGMDGRSTLRIRVNMPRTAITEASLRAAAEVATWGGGSRVVAQYMDMARRMTPYDSMPVLASLLIDADGDLWVEEFLPPGASARRLWCFGSDGLIKGALSLPAELRLLHARDRMLLVATSDENDVESLRAYPIVAR